MYKGRAVDVRHVGRELGVRYVLEGSVRRSGTRVRITVQLVDAASAAQIFGERYDGELTDVFALQDEITEQVAGAVEPTLQASHFERFGFTQPDRLARLTSALRSAGLPG